MIFGTRKHCASASGALLNACSVDSDACTWSGRKTLLCPGTVDEKVEEVVAGKRHIAQLVLPKGSSMADLNTDQLRLAFGLRPEELLTEDDQ